MTSGKRGHGYLGHRRDVARGQCVRQPDIAYGGADGKRFRVWARSDGRYVVTDAERPWNARDVPGSVRDQVGAADLIAQRLAGLHPGAPPYEKLLAMLASGEHA